MKQPETATIGWTVRSLSGLIIPRSVVVLSDNIDKLQQPANYNKRVLQL